MSSKKKKLGYSQYERLLAEAHQKIDMLANKYSELQTYFIGYVEFQGHNIEFNNWMNDRIKEMQSKIEKEKVSEKV